MGSRQWNDVDCPVQGLTTNADNLWKRQAIVIAFLICYSATDRSALRPSLTSCKVIFGMPLVKIPFFGLGLWWSEKG